MRGPQEVHNSCGVQAEWLSPERREGCARSDCSGVGMRGTQQILNKCGLHRGHQSHIHHVAWDLVLPPRADGEFFFFLINLFISGCAGSLLLHRLSLVVVSGGYSSLQYAGFSLRWLLLLRSTGSRCTSFSSCGTWASVVVAHGL